MQRKIYHSIEEIGAETIAHFSGSSLDFSYGLLRAVEKALWGDLAVRYLTIEKNGEAIAFLPAYVGTNVNINALLPHKIQDGYIKLVRALGDLIKTRFVIAGSLISDKGWIPMRPESASAELVAEMAAFVDDFSREEKVKVSMIKDIHCEFPDSWKDCISQQGFERIYSLPTVIVDTDYAKFDDYVQGLKKNARKHARKVLKAAEQAFEFEIVTEIQPYIDEIFPLFRNTYLKAKYQFDETTPYFLKYCAEIDDLGKELVLCRKNGKVVGALLNFYNDSEQLNKRIGIDYDQEETPLIYTSLMYQGMKTAIGRGLKRVYLGQSTYVPKLRLGGYAQDEYFYVKPYDPVLKLSMPMQHRWSSGYQAERVEAMALQGVSV
ncbi:MAG: hypothetical protein Tsb002_00350 [Wenzhouxiangellaceae bacterium]